MKMVLFSGGVDSTTCLAMAKEKDEDVIAISFYYGQRHSEQELNAAKEVAKYYNVKQIFIDLKDVFKHGNSSLIDLDLEVSEGDYAEQENANTEVEFRNGIFISVLASLAMQYKADEIYFGAHKDDSGVIYPDCSPEFVKAMEEAIKVGSRDTVALKVPFLDKTKTELVAYGKTIGVPYNLTYSCYNGTNPPCHKCGTCIDREKAFIANGLDRDGNYAR
ncbi:7-cyano-7-deazaguanine synthase [Chlamydia trachomatis]|nr:7-cyano-7-deazaguanine synthase [Chlamydia trachomatis]